MNITELKKNTRCISGYTSRAYLPIDRDGKFCVKEQFDYLDIDLIRIEYESLVALHDCVNVPNAHYIKKNVLVMDYCGDPLRRSNLPKNWHMQCKNILSALKAANIAHNDIKQDNLCVSNGILYLIDFGWATKIGVSPSESKVGRKHRRPDGVYSDAYSMGDVFTHLTKNAIKFM